MTNQTVDQIKKQRKLFTHTTDRSAWKEKAKHRLTPEQREELVRRYHDGETGEQLSKIFGITPSSVCTLSRRRGLSKKRGKLTHDQHAEVIKRYLAGERTRDLAKEYGVVHAAINHLVVRSGHKARSIWGKHNMLPLNENAFAEITPESAYWVGFLMADGSISDKRNTVKLALADGDILHVEKFKTFLKSDHKIFRYFDNSKKGLGKQGKCGITVPSKKLVDDLAKYGVGPRKSFTAKAIGIENNDHYVRGIIDGDGSITTNNYIRKNYPIISLCGSEDCCKQFLSYAQTFTNTKTKARRDPRYNMWNTAIGGEAAIKIIRRLYSNAPIYLDRKYQKAHELLRWHEAYLSELDSKRPSIT